MKLDYLNHSKFKNYLLDFNQKLESLEGISLTLKSYNRFLKDHNYLFYISSEDGNKIPVIPIDFYLKEVGSNKQYFFKYHLFNETFEVQANKSFTVKKPNDKLWDKLVTKYFNLINASFQESNNSTKTNESENNKSIFVFDNENEFLNDFKLFNISIVNKTGSYVKIIINAILFGVIIFLFTSFYNIIPRPKMIFDNFKFAESILEIVFSFYVVIIYKFFYRKSEVIWEPMSNLLLNRFVSLNLLWFLVITIVYYGCSIIFLKYNFYGIGIPKLPFVYYLIFMFLVLVEFDLIRINSKHKWWKFRITKYYDILFITKLFALYRVDKVKYSKWTENEMINQHEKLFIDKVMLQLSNCKTGDYALFTWSDCFYLDDYFLSPYPKTSLFQGIYKVYTKIKEEIAS
jgi:hypothetical protein